MALVLYAVASLMALGGLAAIYSGSDIIVMERGWTMVIAGSVVAASGALLAGVATVVARLQGLESEFTRLSDRLGRPQEPSLPLSPAPPSDMVVERGASRERPSPPPLVAVPDLVAHRDLDVTPEPVLSPPSPPEPAPETTPDEIPAAVRELPEIVAEPDAPEREPVPDTAAMETAPEQSAPTVVGTYNSGGNFYIMYSDGSIEAETPAGKFRFDSLEELKDFIARGGDKARAGTPA